MNAEIEQGKLTLPDLPLLHVKDYVAIWALVDSGSSVHVVDAPQEFPDADIQAPPKDAKGFQATDGRTIPHKGSVVTPMRVTEGDLGKVVEERIGSHAHPEHEAGGSPQQRTPPS